MRVGLFDWTTGGHHRIYAKWIADALNEVGEVVLALPDEELDEREGWPLGSARPVLDHDRPLRPQHRDLAERELDLLFAFAEDSQLDHVVHLYSDPVLRRLVERPSLPCPATICVFFPRAHYRRSFGTRLGAKELARALFLESLVKRWRRRTDAHAIFTLDEAAVQRWNARPGPRAFYLPEPPVVTASPMSATREGCVLYGTLAARKGVDLVAAALSSLPGSSLTLAGEVEPDYAQRLQELTAALAADGVEIELRPERHDEQDAIQLLAGARCAVLPYVSHYTRSRVLLESAKAGTPVVAHEQGLLGHIVRTRGLGLTVDCRDARAFREAVALLTAGADQTSSYAANLSAFADAHSETSFAASVLAPFRSTAHRPYVAQLVTGESA